MGLNKNAQMMFLSVLLTSILVVIMYVYDSVRMSDEVVVGPPIAGT